MRIDFPKDPVAWDNFVERLLVNLRVDYDRLWRNLPQIPDPEIGIPFTGPLDPTKFCWPFQDCAVGSGSVSVSIGTPFSFSQWIGTKPDVATGVGTNCNDCSTEFHFEIDGFPDEPGCRFSPLNGRWTVSNADPGEACRWVSDGTASGVASGVFYWSFVIVSSGPLGFKASLFAHDAGDTPFALYLSQDAVVPSDCPITELEFKLQWVHTCVVASGTNWPYRIPHTLTLFSGP